MASDGEVPVGGQADVAQAKDALRDLFTVMGIKRIIVVDDELSTPLDSADVLGEIRARINGGRVESLAAVDALTGIDFAAPSEIVAKAFHELWKRMDANQQSALAESLEVKKTESTESEGRGILGTLLSDYGLSFLSLQQWRQSKDEILKEAATHPSLFLFDQDMRKNNGSATEGMTWIANLLKGQANDPPLYCGLLTNVVTVENEHSDHTKFASDNGLEKERDRFAVISKQHLHQQPLGLAVRLKRVAISPWCEKLKVHLVEAVKAAVDDAAAKVAKLDVYDFEQIVFQSSYKEGVWEADTLLRLFSLYHRESARTRAKDSNSVVQSADMVRSVISLPYRPRDRKGTQAREITRLELYESADYLLRHRMPIDIGDIFQKTGGNKRYLLLEQPCDLMVRGDSGKRNANSVVLVELKEQSETEKVGKSSVELEFYSAEEGRKCFAIMSSCVIIPACILDLCVFNDQGIAELQLGAACPNGLIHAWKLRYGIIQSEAAAIVQKFRDFTAIQGAPQSMKAYLQGTLTGSVAGVVKGEVKSNPDRIVYNLKRVGRLKQPRAAALLRELAQFKARDAFDHDLVRTIGHDACSVSETCE